MGWFNNYCLISVLILSIVGYSVLLSFATFAQEGSDVGGTAYCGKGIVITASATGEVDFPLKMGTPETWSNSIRLDIYQSITHEDHASDLNIDTNEVLPELINVMRRKGKFVFPCAILKDKASWKRYWLNDPAATQRIKLLKQSHEKYMDCLYDHRKEINKLNKKVIEHRCKKKTRWEPPGYESVAEGEM